MLLTSIYILADGSERCCCYQSTSWQMELGGACGDCKIWTRVHIVQCKQELAAKCMAGAKGCGLSAGELLMQTLLVMQSVCVVLLQQTDQVRASHHNVLLGLAQGNVDTPCSPP